MKNSQNTASVLAKNEKSEYTKTSSITRQAYKDSLFTEIFSTPEHFKSVYGAILGKDISDIKVIQFNNEPLLTVDIRNDVAMMVDNRLIVFIEHQSTINNNMALRMLWYASAAFKKHIGEELVTVFGTKPVRLPRPEFYVFYAGKRNWGKTTLKLSDLYDDIDDNDIMLDLNVKVINMRDENSPVMLNCQAAHIYIELLERIEELIQEGNTRDNAIHLALTELSKRESPLHDFLSERTLEVKNMINYQLTLEEVAEYAARIHQQEHYDDGFDAGIEKGIEKGELKGKLSTAKNFLAMGLTIEQIAAGTGLSELEIRKLI